MARFNRTFYDLNHERRYCFAAADESVPSAVISDMKISVPSYSALPVVTGLLSKEDSVQVVVAVGGQIAVTFTSNSRNTLRSGRVYAMKSWKEGYEGVLVFGSLKEDVHYKGTAPVSEECLTRYSPSEVPYVSIPCTGVRLTGEVSIGGDSTHSRSFTERLPEGCFTANESMMLDLIDTGVTSSDNPMILYANGINAFNDIENVRAPIYTLCGFPPDLSGSVFVRFEDHFKIAAVAKKDVEDASISALVVGTTITHDDVCYPPTSVDDGSSVTDGEDCPIEFIEIEYAPHFC